MSADGTRGESAGAGARVKTRPPATPGAGAASGQGETPADPFTTILVFALPTLAAFGPLITGIGSFFLFRIVALLFFFGALLTFRRGVRSPMRGFTLLLASVWLVVAGLSLVSFGANGNSGGELLSLGTGLALLTGAAIVRSPRALLMAFLRGWMLAYIVISLYAVAEIVTGVSLSSSYAEERTLDGWGITVSFYNPNNYATFLLFSFIALVLLWGKSTTMGMRVASVACLITVPMFMHAANSRTGVLVLGAFIVAFVLMILRGHVGLRLFLVLLAAIGALLLLQSLERTPFEEFSQFAGGTAYRVSLLGLEIPVDASTFVRWNLVLVGLVLASTHLLLGAGPGSYEGFAEVAGSGYQTMGIINPHNGFVEVLSQYGIIVFAVFVLWLLRLLGTAFRARRQPELSSRVVWIGLTLGILSLPIVLTMHSSAIEPSTTWLFFTLLLLAARGQEGIEPLRSHGRKGRDRTLARRGA